MRRLSTFLIGCMLSVCVWAHADSVDVPVTEDDSIYISLITCSPGNEAYTLFGHTALHVRTNVPQSLDYVFNYGLFNYNAKGFLWRFVKGETDYELGAEPTDFFFGRYVDRGYTVWEQELNLTSEEKHVLLGLILWNAQPTNKTYRYNFLYDNCTTRARAIIGRALAAVDAQLILDESAISAKCTTFREIIHTFTNGSPWLEFGIDMLLGAEVDRQLGPSDRMFVPSRLHDAMVNAVVKTADGAERGLVAKETVHRPTVAAIRDIPLSIPGPLIMMLVLLVLTAIMTVYDWHRGRRSLWYDICLLTLQLIAGILISMLFCFSEHPAVGSNWLVVFFNPILPLALCFSRGRARMIVRYVYLAAALFTLLLFALPLQCLPIALLPAVLSLTVRSLLKE